MVTLAMLFALQQKVAYRDRVPLLSTHDIVELLSYYLPIKKNPNKKSFGKWPGGIRPGSNLVRASLSKTSNPLKDY